MKRLEVWLAAGLTAIVAVMPYHAFLSVWIGSLTGQEALVQVWKELLLAVLALAAAVGIMRSMEWRRRLFQPTVILATLFALVALIVTLGTRPQLAGVAYGIKTDLEFLLAYILAVIAASSLSPSKLGRIIVTSGIITALIGLALVTVLPHDTLRHFGYSAATISPYEHVDPQITAIRTPSTLGGPNQFGTYLIVPFALVLAYWLKRRRWQDLLYAIVMFGGIFVSYSRAALLGAVAAAIIVTLLSLPQRYLKRAVAVATVLVVLAGIALGVASKHTDKFGIYVFHQDPHVTVNKASTTDHILAFQNGLTEIELRPWGRGLGSAGPASYHTATPFIPESYYLQIGVEAGVIGLIVFLGLLLRLALDLFRRRAHLEARAALAALIGISVVCLALHGWADSSVALIFWIFAGSIIGASATEPTEKAYLLGVKLDNLHFDEAVTRIEHMIEQHDGGLIATVNAEFIVNAQRDKTFRDILNNSALSLADGSGPTIMSRYIGQKLVARIPGVDLTEALMKQAAIHGWRVYLYGGFDGAGQQAADVWQQRYKDLVIAGVHEPAAHAIDDILAIKAIKAAKPDIILVALGGAKPRQEPWIDQHLSETGATIGIGVGGTFDYVIGRTSRAPKLMRRLGLEWLYRLSRQPARFKRMLALPYFVYLVVRHGSRPKN